jgi:hypothetical protein
LGDVVDVSQVALESIHPEEEKRNFERANSSNHDDARVPECWKEVLEEAEICEMETLVQLVLLEMLALGFRIQVVVFEKDD